MPVEARAAIQRTRGAAPKIEPVTLDDPRADEVLVRIEAVGICHTDMVMRDGHLPVPMPVVLGHEGAGVVEAVGADVSDLSIGDKVVLSFASCGQCRNCDDGQPSYCLSWVPLNFFGARADGTCAMRDSSGAKIHSHIFGQSSFASHALVNRRDAVRIESDIPFEVLAPLGCGIQTGAGTILNVLKPRSGASVAVIGTGAVGMSAIMAAAIAGVRKITAVDVNEKRVATARMLGASHGFRADRPLKQMAAQAGCSAGFNYIIDTTGNPDICRDAVEALALRGEIALVGAYPDADMAIRPGHMMSGGRTIRGVVEGSADPQRFIPELIRYYENGQFPFDRLIKTFPFEDIANAISSGETGEVIKPVLVLR